MHSAAVCHADTESRKLEDTRLGVCACRKPSFPTADAQETAAAKTGRNVQRFSWTHYWLHRGFLLVCMLPAMQISFTVAHSPALHTEEEEEAYRDNSSSFK